MLASVRHILYPHAGLLWRGNDDVRIELQFYRLDLKKPYAAMHTRELTSDNNSTDERKTPKALVAAVFLTSVITRGLATVLIYRVQKAMANYTAILMSIYWPVGVLFICFLLLFFVNRFDLAWFSPFSPLASQEGSVPQRWFVLMAFLH